MSNTYPFHRQPTADALLTLTNRIAIPEQRTRREFLRQSGSVLAGAALASAVRTAAYAGETNTIQIALVGTGGRGTGAAANALSVSNGPIKLVAMADVFEDRLAGSRSSLQQGFGDKMDLPPERQFVGFDAYRKAIDCLSPGDVVILATPPAFRWVHFAYAIEKGVNVFMEKPVSVDGPSSKRMLALAQQSVEKNLKVGVGLMCRHCKARRELSERIKADELGNIIALRAYRLHGPVGSFFSEPKPANENELLWQIRRFHSFLWASGGAYSDGYIHHIDECCWMKDAWPVRAQANGGRHFRGNCVDQNFDNYSVEYTFGDGTKLFFYGRTIPGCYDHFASYAHGSKGVAGISIGSHSPARCCVYNGHNMSPQDLAWKFAGPEPNPYELEWEHLIAAIREDKPYNEAKRGTEASLVTAMGRMAAHTGQIVTYDEMLNHEHDLTANADAFTLESPAPVVADSHGRYPTPQPGISTKREY